jgi:hypothetical protein
MSKMKTVAWNLDLIWKSERKLCDDLKMKYKRRKLNKVVQPPPTLDQGNKSKHSSSKTSLPQPYAFYLTKPVVCLLGNNQYFTSNTPLSSHGDMVMSFLDPYAPIPLEAPITLQL